MQALSETKNFLIISTWQASWWMHKSGFTYSCGITGFRRCCCSLLVMVAQEPNAASRAFATFHAVAAVLACLAKVRRWIEMPYVKRVISQTARKFRK